MTDTREVILLDNLDIAQLRILRVKMIGRNNTRAEITRANAAIRSSHAQLMRDFDGQPELLMPATIAMNHSLALLAYMSRMCDIEEEEDLECYRLLLWRG
ncbi:hypothetical protein N7489_002563 [Penicillium chrysogenum]|uniref:Uncharacterized protein n=1 Tax=Penicillium chrysogenum TaxID=5076 RepID=A0ABQ8WPX0_PENCH|nr:uncharacterized protein N7489_002563 [Penicillium chrysogenum]KAJ5252153.1 hypothetical protein N7489_002563 [Penicillium chrysogenum]KAJ5271061.1 hypothetical protein N7505_006819 [Penicillium chrysogenum]